MAFDPSPYYRIVADNSLTPEQKRAQIDALAMPPPIDVAPPQPNPVEVPPPGPDQRLAMNAAGLQNMPLEPQQAAAPAVGMPAPSLDTTIQDLAKADAAMHVAPIPAETPQVTAPAVSEVPPSPVQAVEKPPMSADAAANEIARTYIANAMRPSPAHLVPEHDQPTSTVIEGRSPVPGELTQERRAAEQEQIDQTLNSGIDAALIAQKNEDAAAARIAQEQEKARAFEEQQRQVQERLAQKQAEYDQLAKDTELNPKSWWQTKSTGDKITSVIGAVLLGLGGDTQTIERMIEREQGQLQGNRNQKLSDAQQKLKTFQESMLSPEAASNMRLAMSNRVAAAEMEKLAASSQQSEVRTRAAEHAADLRAKAAEYEAKAWQDEHGTMNKTQIAHVPAKVVGGGGGVKGGIQAGKTLGMTGKETLQLMGGGTLDLSGLTPEQRDEEKKRRVMLPSGQTLWAPRQETAEKATDAAMQADNLITSYNQMEKILSKPEIREADRQELARLSAIVADTTMDLAVNKKLGALSESDRGLLNPITGENALKVASFDKASLAGLQQARQLLQRKTNTLYKTLSTTPDLSGARGGSTSASVGFKPGGG